MSFSPHGARHGRDRRGSRRRTLWICVVAALTVVGLSGAALSAKRGGATQEECSINHLTVVAAPAIAPVVADVVKRLPARSCPTITVAGQEPADVADAVAAGGVGPDVWIPDSSIWLERLRAAGRVLDSDPTSVARSPVVLAMTSVLARQLRIPARAGISAVLGTQTTARAIQIGLPDPERSAPAAAALLDIQAALRGRPDTREARTVAFRSAALGLPTNAEQLLAGLAHGQPRAVAVSEQAVWAHNAHAGGGRAVALYPESDGTVLDYPYVVLRADAAAGALARRLQRLLSGDVGARLLTEHGFRAPNGRPGAELDLAHGTDPGAAATATVPQPQAASEAVRTLLSLRMPSRMLAVFDVSGSMALQVPGTKGRTRLDLAREAAVRGLDLFSDDDEIGLWEFATRLTATSDHREQVPIVPLGERRSGLSGRYLLAKALGETRVAPHGDTALYDTTLAAVRAVRAAWDPRRVNSVLLLTDGRNDDKDGLTLDQLLRTLAHEADPARAVRVITVAYGPDSDSTSLARISRATGGVSYVAKDPRDIPSVFLDAIGQRPAVPATRLSAAASGSHGGAG